VVEEVEVHWHAEDGMVGCEWVPHGWLRLNRQFFLGVVPVPGESARGETDLIGLGALWLAEDYLIVEGDFLHLCAPPTLLLDAPEVNVVAHFQLAHSAAGLQLL
jgi:hypothetical protein